MPMVTVSQLFSENLLDGFQLKNINFNQNEFENVAIIGETGSGKSTLLKIIAGFNQYQRGEIIFDNKIVLGPNYQLVPGQKGIAYLSQHFELRHNYKMKDLLAIDNQLSLAESNEIIELCKVNHLMNRNSKQLSGGEKQRMALAKLLISKPKLLILDEPYSNLDIANKILLKQVVLDVCTRFAITSLLTSHDPQDVLPWANKIIVMQQGIIIQEDTPQNVYRNPVNEYAASLLGNFIIKSKNICNTFQINASANFSIIRPDKILILDKIENDNLFTIIAARYFGSYYELDIVLENQLVTLLSAKEYKAQAQIAIQFVD
jgi:ABC-type sulfate/molybdate transport systems ATPase subunit